MTSKEGVTQGCPLLMVAYGLLVFLMIIKLRLEFLLWLATVWFANNGTAGGKDQADAGIL